MTHDHTRITALVDDELSPADRERALAHVTSCPECRAAYLQERAAKRALADGRVDNARERSGVEPSTALLSSLLSMAEPGEPLALARTDDAPDGDAPDGGAPGGGAPDGGAVVSTSPRTLPEQRKRRARRAAKGLGFSLAGVVALCAVAFALGGPDDDTRVQPPVDRYAQEHARTAATLPFGDASADVLGSSAGTGP